MFDHVQPLHPAQFSADSNDQTRRQSVMFNVFLSSSITFALAVETVLNALFFHCGIALHFSEKINRITCSARAVYEAAHDDFLPHEENMHFSFGTRIQIRMYRGNVFPLLEEFFLHHTLMRRLSVEKTGQKETKNYQGDVQHPVSRFCLFLNFYR